jgi:hypothetical protein
MSLTPSAFAVFSAPSFIFTKNGLVSVFVIRPTLTSPEPEPAEPDAEPEPEPDPQAVRVRAAMPVHAAALRRETGRRRVVRDMNDSCGVTSGAVGI